MEIANNKITVGSNGTFLQVKNPNDSVGRLHSDLSGDIIDISDIRISKRADISSNLTVDGIFDLSGNADLSSNLLVRKNVDVCGNVFIDGDLTVMGNRTVIDVVTLDISDVNITLGKTGDFSSNDIIANNGGITLLAGPNAKNQGRKTIKWEYDSNDVSNSVWSSSEHWNIEENKAFRVNNIHFYSQGDMDISSSLVTDSVMDISAEHLTTGNVIDISASSLTTGYAINLDVSGNALKAVTDSSNNYVMMDLYGSGDTGRYTLLKLATDTTDPSGYAMDVSGTVNISGGLCYRISSCRW